MGARIGSVISSGTLTTHGAVAATGDLTFSAGTFGPVIKDQSNGHTYRLIATAGVLSLLQVT